MKNTGILSAPIHCIAISANVIGSLSPAAAKASANQPTAALPPPAPIGVNHFTILISERGARLVADEVRSVLNGHAGR